MKNRFYYSSFFCYNKNNNKGEKNMKKNIAIIVLSIGVVFLGSFSAYLYFTKSKTTCSDNQNIVYKFNHYNNNNIESNSDLNFTTKYEFYSNYNMLNVIITNNESTSYTVSANIKIYDFDGNIINDNSIVIGTMKNGNTNDYTIALPTLSEEQYAGKIEITYSYSKILDDITDKNIFTSTFTKSSNDDSSTINLTISDSNKITAKSLDCIAVIIKDGKVQDVVYFTIDNYKSSSTKSVSTYIKDFDDVKVYINDVR